MKKYPLFIALIACIILNIPISFASGGACSSHDGVSCTSGMDIDGSVICNDGWRDSSVSYGEADECLNDNIYYSLMDYCDLAGLNGLELYKTEYKKELNRLMDDYQKIATPLPESPVYPGSTSGGYADLATCLETQTFPPYTSAATKIQRCGNQVNGELEKYNDAYSAYSSEVDRINDAYDYYKQYVAHDEAVMTAIDVTSDICRNSINGTPITNAAQTGQLSDIEGYKYEIAIKSLLNDKIIEGYSDGTYKPDININRAEFTKIVIGSTGKLSNGNNCFPDVNNEWFAPYVCTAKNLGIIEGYPDGTFKPNQSITSAEALKITLEAHFDNIPEVEGEWWLKYSMFANLYSLRPEEWTLPETEIRRGEMAELIYRISQPLNATI